MVIDKFDKLQQQCESIQIKMANLLHKTHSETIYVKQEPQDDASEDENDDFDGSFRSFDFPDGNNRNPLSFYCEQCEEDLQTANGLKVHLATDHDRNDGPVDCPICLKPSNDPTALRSHMKSHSVDRNYLCGR